MGRREPSGPSAPPWGPPGLCVWGQQPSGDQAGPAAPRHLGDRLVVGSGCQGSLSRARGCSRRTSGGRRAWPGAAGRPGPLLQRGPDEPTRASFPKAPGQRQEESAGVGATQLPGASVAPARVPTTGVQRPQSTVAVRLFPPSAGVPGRWVQHCWPGASQDAEQTGTFSKPSATVASLRICRGTAGVTLPTAGGTQAWGRVGGWDAGPGGPSSLVPVPGALPGLARDTGLVGG